MRKLFTLLLALLAMASAKAATQSAEELQALGLRNIDRAMTILDAVWQSSVRGEGSDMWFADNYDTVTDRISGPSDVWPYTAAIEAHCGILEALNAAKSVAPELHAEKFPIYADRLAKLIDNLEWYRGTYRLPSYASNRVWSPYAVPRAGKRGEANVTGILNVYDDQMWLSRELIRAYKVTNEKKYLDLAAYLADYVIDGWDCWRDANGKEYGGITWGPGYNSKHACSNAPMIQPLVWLARIYEGTGETMDHYYRDEKNNPVKATKPRSEVYMEFARKIYDWQKEKLLNSDNGLYWDMMGAPGEIKVSKGYRQHVDNGGPVGNYYSYNTGTMIAGAAELYRSLGDATYIADLAKTVPSSVNGFAKYVRKHGTYEFNTDATAANGFNSWFNNVLMRSYFDVATLADADPTAAVRGLRAFQTTLDYAFENHLRKGMLPIHFLDGWGTETLTKGFHQSSFVAEYTLLAIWHLNSALSGITAPTVDPSTSPSADSAAAPSPEATIFTLSGQRLGTLSTLADTLPRGIYIANSRKHLLGH